MKHRRLVLPAFLAVLGFAPALLPEFYITLLNHIGLAAIVALGLVLLTWVGGLTSFGQAAFVGLGAYTSAYLTTAYALSPWLTLLAGLAVMAAVALFLGLLTLRLSGHYLPSPGASACTSCSATSSFSVGTPASPAFRCWGSSAGGCTAAGTSTTSSGWCCWGQ